MGQRTVRNSGGVLLDTHSWLWLATGDERLPVSARTVLSRCEVAGQLYVAAISLLEMANMSRKKRVLLPVPLGEWFERALSEANIQVIPLNPRIAVETAYLPEEFHGDPADRLIAATARVEDLTICTHDKELIRFGKQGVFRILAI
jgi:PIN domain nuclease of toxin-antitoxin system